MAAARLSDEELEKREAEVNRERLLRAQEARKADVEKHKPLNDLLQSDDFAHVRDAVLELIPAYTAEPNVAPHLNAIRDIFGALERVGANFREPDPAATPAAPAPTE
jgi:hypothetical protein